MSMDALKRDLEEFVDSLAMEGDRSAVVLGAERINLALEMLLIAYLKPSDKDDDNLFGREKPLEGFNSRINLAHRLGLLDDEFRNALRAIMRLRNKFAHATKLETLKTQEHASRVESLGELLGASKGRWSGTALYLQCVLALLLKLELLRHFLKRPQTNQCATLNDIRTMFGEIANPSIKPFTPSSDKP
jgi:hypothetical protein